MTRNLSRMGTALPAVALAALLAGCPGQPRPTAGRAGQAVPTPPGGNEAARTAHLGRPYDVVASESLLTILAYRAGALAKAGHNHVIASHDLAGTVYVPDKLAQTSVEIRIPVEGMTVDETALRSKEGSDFSAEVPDSAKEGTRRNMLSEALLDVAHSPEITLASTALDGVGGASGTGGANSGDLTAHIQVGVRQAKHDILVPVHYEMKPDELVLTGELPLKQTDLGLTPFSALLGALQVQDEMRVKFRFVARAAPR